MKSQRRKIMELRKFRYGALSETYPSYDLEKVYTDLQKIAESGKVENPYRYLGVRGDE